MATTIKPVDMTITAYKDSDFSKEVGSFDVKFVPEDLKKGNKVEYGDDKGLGASGATLKFKGITNDEVKMQFLFDSTGAVPGTKGSLAEKLDTFYDLCMGYDGDIHRTNYLKLIWGPFLLKGVMTDMHVNYKLFKTDGTPVQAMVDGTFRESLSPTALAAEEGNNSPDLTHVRTVRPDETLPAMSARIYGDHLLYAEVARANKLRHLRDLRQGDYLEFPPIDKNNS